MTQSAPSNSLVSEMEDLRLRLREAEEIIHAIRHGEVDAIMVQDPGGDQVYTLKSAEHPYRVFVEGMCEGALTLAMDGSILFSNQAFAHMIGQPLDQVMGIPLVNFVANGHHPILEQLLSAAYPDGARGEVELLGQQGLPFPVQLSFFPLALEQIQAISVIVTNLTEQRREAASRAIAQAEREARLKITNILENITDCYLLLDQELRCIDVNRRAMKQVFNCTRAEVLGKKIADLEDTAENFTDFRERLHETLDCGEPRNFEIKTGAHHHWFEVHAYPQDTRLAVYMRNIDDRKLVEIDLRALNETLEQRIAQRTLDIEDRSRQLQALARQLINAEQRERRRLAADLHDFLAQLLVVCKLKHAKLDRYLDDKRAADLFEDIGKLLDQSLTYTRTLIAELSPTTLQRAGLMAGLQALAVQMEHFGLRVKIESSGDQFEIPENEAVLIYHSIRELLLNVLKHAQVEIAEVHCIWESGQLSITIRDNGKGFDQKLVNLAPSVEGKFGLLNVRERVEAIGGRFDLQSQPGQGTTISMTLQIKTPWEAARITARGDRLTPLGASVESANNIVSVLLVDDHRMVREGLRTVIDSTPDLRVIGEAGDGEEAVKMEELLNPAVIVMDVNMPNVNGIEACRSIKQRRSEVVIIGLSIFDDEEVAQVMCAAGAAVLVGKSRAADDLCDTIRQHVFGGSAQAV